MRRQTGSMLCPSCRKLISVDEPKCPFCGALRPGLWGWGPTLQSIFGGRLDLIPVLTGACVVLYVVGLLLDLPGAMRSQGLLNFLSPSGVALYRLGMTGPVGLIDRWYTLFTAIYLHGGLLHIFFNLMSLRNLGPEAQRVFGPARFFILWTITGAAGFLVSNLFGPFLDQFSKMLGAGFSIGASGAIFGVLGALIAFARRQGTTLGDLASRQMLQWAAILLIFGFVTPGINNLAHLGGFAAGYLCGRSWPAAHQRREGRGTQILALVLLAVTLAGFVLSLTQARIVTGD